ncbi:uncharacterized protein LOC116204960 isoform X2 [Punica granatum]|nr:uncharacterized protein LOC116204960 isoform X2 [Punica granatum]
MEAINMIDQQIEHKSKEIQKLSKEIQDLRTARTTLAATFGITSEEPTICKDDVIEAPLPRPKTNWAKEVEEEEVKTKERQNVESQLSTLSRMTIRSSNEKKYYVIFNGPMEGIFDDWSKAALPINGKQGVVHKSYNSLDDAKKAIKEYEEESSKSFAQKLLVPAPAASINRLRSLGKIPSATKPSLEEPSTISTIPTKSTVDAARKITMEKFKERFLSLVHYKEEYKAHHFYPVWRGDYGPKVVVLPEASGLTVWEFFANGLVDTIYAQSTTFQEQFSLFPQRVLETIRHFNNRVLKGQPMYFKTFSVYPSFLEGGEILKPSFALGCIGRSNEMFQPIEVAPEYAQEDKFRDLFYINNYTGLCKRLQRIKEETKVNYKSKTILLYSVYVNHTLSPQMEKTIQEFERPILDLEHCKPRLKEALCMALNGSQDGEWVGNHRCTICTPPLEAQKEEAHGQSPEGSDSGSIELVME